MALSAELAALRRDLRWTGREEREMAEVWFEQKVAVYEFTLDDLADDLDYELPEDFELSQAVRDELWREAREHARLVVRSYNEDLQAFLERNADREADDVLADYEAWASDRADTHAEMTAITEAYSAHADATVAFFDAVPGVEFEFGGHPELGDSPPECPICQAIESTNPHPPERVRAIGNPHIQCRQSWHPIVHEDDLPDELDLGQAAAGIVGTEPLVNRTGGKDQALSAVEEITGGR